MTFEDLQFMSLGSNCVFLACFPKEIRLRGPVDNVSLKGVNGLKLLIEDKFFTFVKTSPFQKIHKKRNEYKDGDCVWTSTFPNDTVSFIHNVPEGEHFLENLKIRCDNLRKYLSQVKTDKNKWLIFTLNGNFVQWGTSTLIKNNLLDILMYLKQCGLLHKTIVIGSRVDKSDYKVFNHYLNTVSLQKLQKIISFNYLELTDVNAWEPESTQKQFKQKIIPYITSIQTKGINYDKA